jgi:hypothetical protein
MRHPIPTMRKASLIPLKIGQIVGYVDPKTKDLIFTNRKIKIPRSGTTRVSKEGYELLRQHYGLAPAGTMKPRMVKHLNVFLPAPHISGIGGGRGGGGAGGGGNCGSSCWCWYISEGGAMCQGCCIDVGNGYCSCWEFCVDVSSSGQTTPAR